MATTEKQEKLKISQTILATVQDSESLQNIQDRYREIFSNWQLNNSYMVDYQTVPSQADAW